MESEFILSFSDARSTLENVGGKGASLARLAVSSLPVPGGFCVTTQAYYHFVDVNHLQPGILSCLKDLDLSVPSTLEMASCRIQELFLKASIPAELANAVVGAYAAIPGDNPAVAVRSSATAEDLPGASFAGQQETYLNIRSAEDVLEATRKCWASLWTARAIGYRARQGIAPDQVALAVVIQELVPAEAAGILFTANPLNGQRDQVVVNAAWGLGEAIVGGLVTPDTYTIEKAGGKVLARQIADKQLMTVKVDSGTHEQSVPEDLRRKPVLDDPALLELSRLGLKIEDLYGMPMDIEWALTSGELHILQARPITALPEPQLPAPTSWPMPDPKGSYMRGSVIDFMPDPVTPLFGSLLVPSLNGSLHDLITRETGRTFDMFDNYMTTINRYPYIYTRYTPRQWLQLIFFMAPVFPRLARNSVSLWKDRALPEYQEVTARWGSKDLATLTPSELLTGVIELMKACTDHAAAMQVGTLGVAAASEGLFTAIYDKLIKRNGDALAPTYLMGFDSAPIRAEKALYELAGWCRRDEKLAAYLLGTPSAKIAADLEDAGAPAGVSSDSWSEYCKRFIEYLEHYGYSIYDMDFAKPLPMDEPAPIIEMIKLYLAGQGKNPHARQGAAADRREEAAQAAMSRLKGPKAWLFRKSLSWAQNIGPVREDSIAQIGLGYPVIRRLLAELGSRLLKAGAIACAGEVYWVEYPILERAVTALEAGSALDNLSGLAHQNRLEWEACRRAEPPIQLPKGQKILGVKADTWLGVHGENTEGSILKGLGASPGRATGTARVLNGPEDFDQMHPGDVLVASLTTPAWTPLFSMASAVVTDIGGPLSHGSIVAREYGIPAVLGTGVATHRIQSGQRVTVDGTRGVVEIES